MIFYDTQYNAYSSTTGLVPPLSEITNIDMPEEQIPDQNYLASCLSKKVQSITAKGNGKLNFGGMNEKVIAKLLLARLPQYANLLNYGGYGIAENGDFYFDYNDLSASEFDINAPDHSDDRRIVGRILTTGEAALTIVEGSDRGRYVLKTKTNAKSKSTTHSAAALIYGLAGKMITSVENGLVVPGDNGYEVASTIYAHFKDALDTLNSAGSEDDVIKAVRCLDNDLYSLFTYPSEMTTVYGSIPVKIRQYDKEVFDVLNLDNLPKMDKLYGSSCFLEGRRKINAQGDMTKDIEIKRTVGEILKSQKDRYSINPTRVLTVSEQALVPNKSDMIPNKEILKKVSLIKDSTTKSPHPFRNLLWTGETGSGKSTACQIAAQLLGIPYVFITINPDTLLSDLYANFLPRTDKALDRQDLDNLASTYPDYEEISMFPAQAYFKITGTKNSKATEQDCIKAMLADMYNKVNSAGDFVCVKSDLVKAVENGWFVEIQEANLASKPGVLGGINALMDDLGTIVLPTGEVIHRHPDCVVALTANVDYEGTRRLNQAVKSRCQLKGVFELPDDNSLAQIVKQDSGYANERNIIDMIKVMKSVRKVLAENGETSGSCGLREIVAWAQAIACQLEYGSEDHIYEYALDTIIPSATDDPEIRVSVEQAVATQFAA